MRLGERPAVTAAVGALSLAVAAIVAGGLSFAATGAVHAASRGCTVSIGTQCPGSGVYASARETAGSGVYASARETAGSGGVPGHGNGGSYSPAGSSGSATPMTQLGIYTTAEADSGSYSTEPGQTPDVGNYYLPYGESYPAAFASAVSSAGATPFIEIEPWEEGQGSDTCSVNPSEPSVTTIGANGSSVQSYLESLGAAVASAGKPVIFTFAHEFNYDGQYPWSQGNCEGTTAVQWITAWDAVRDDVDSTADGLASFMWVPDIYYAGGGAADISPAAYWPGPSNVDMVGVDGYPDGPETFSALFGPSFSIIDGLSGESAIPQPSIFIAETNFEPLGPGIAAMVQDICTSGGDGTLQFLYQEPDLTSSEWSALDSATAAYCPGSGNGLTSAPTTAPAAPRVSGGTTTSISWNIPPADTSTADHWSYFELLVLGSEGSVQHDGDVSTNSASMYLSPAGERYIKVRACNTDGCSAYSTSVGYDN